MLTSYVDLLLLGLPETWPCTRTIPGAKVMSSEWPVGGHPGPDCGLNFKPGSRSVLGECQAFPNGTGDSSGPDCGLNLSQGPEMFRVTVFLSKSLVCSKVKQETLCEGCARIPGQVLVLG